MIEYVEARNSALEVIGIIDTAQSIIWHSVYYGVGDFEIFIKLQDAIHLLNDVAYITRTDNEEVGVVESILIAEDIESGKMLTLKGRFAKSILDRRIVYSIKGTSNTATILEGNVERDVRRLVSENAIDARSLEILELGALTGIDYRFIDDAGMPSAMQVSWDNLLTCTETILKAYGLAARVKLNGNKLQYSIYEGIDRSNDIVFSKEFDNLLSSEYSLDSSFEKNVAIIGGEGEGSERFCVILGSQGGLARKEVFVDAKSLSRKYKDEQDIEQTYTDAEYTILLKQHAMQATASMIVTEDFNGAIDITNGTWLFGRDFMLGDIVSIQENELGLFKAVRIAEVTEFQDEDGYSVEVIYQGE